MTEQLVVLNEDRTLLTIGFPDGREVHMRSSRPDGFRDAEIDRALSNFSNTTMVPGEKRRARLTDLTSGWQLYSAVNTGPPTWWVPRIEISLRKKSVMVGWLRGLVHVRLSRKKG